MKRLSNQTLTLSRFLLRQQTIRLYRDFMRLIRRVDNEKHKRELRDWIWQDFKANMHHNEEAIIKMHLSRGKMALREMETMVSLANAK